MITLSELIDTCKSEAIFSKFSPTEASSWRWFCREYCKLFHTSLHIVQSLSPEFIILNVFEEHFDSKSASKDEDFLFLKEQFKILKDPNYNINEEKAFDDFVANMERFESRRLKENGKIPAPKRKNNKESTEKIVKEMPKEGFIDLSYLTSEEEV